MDICFKGFVDKMLVDDCNNIVSIIDYKTGNPDLNLNHTIYGLDLQLPVYIYLARKKFSNSKIAGFYLQKILNNEISKDFKHSYEILKKDKLKLQGYSNQDEKILEKFDSSYQDSHVIKGMRTTSKGIASKKVLSDEVIDGLENLTEEIEVIETTEDIVCKKDEKLRLFKDMQKLDNLSREVVYLRTIGNLNFIEIGEILGKTANWARVTFYRAKQKIREVNENGKENRM